MGKIKNRWSRECSEDYRCNVKLEEHLDVWTGFQEITARTCFWGEIWKDYWLLTFWRWIYRDWILRRICCTHFYPSLRASYWIFIQFIWLFLTWILLFLLFQRWWDSISQDFSKLIRCSMHKRCDIQTGSCRWKLSSYLQFRHLGWSPIVKDRIT